MASPDLPAVDTHNREVAENLALRDNLNLDRVQDPYIAALVKVRTAYIDQYCHNGQVLDVGCGTGDYCRIAATSASHVTGIDYSARRIELARQRTIEQNIENVDYICSDLHFVDWKNQGPWDAVISYSALMYIPRVQELMAHISARVNPGGTLILELGNRWSWNTVLCKFEDLNTYHFSVCGMKQMARNFDLELVDHRVFQFFALRSCRISIPLIGRGMALVHRGMRSLLSREVRGRALDEHISNLPLLRQLSYRHFLVLRKR